MVRKFCIPMKSIYKLLKLLILASIPTLSGCFSSPSNGEKKTDEHLNLLWEYTYNPDGGAPRIKPLLVLDKIITSGDISVTALDFKTGDLLWKTPFENHRQLLNRSFGLNGSQIVGSVVRKVLSWDLESGQPLWEVDFSNVSFNNTRGINSLSNGFITVGSDGSIYKISQNGHIEIIILDARSYEATHSNGILFVGQAKNEKGIVSAYQLDTMELLWRFEPGSFGYPAYAPPIIENNIVYAGTLNGPGEPRNGFFALNADTGQEIWRREGIFTYAAILEGDRIFGVNGNSVWALNKTTGNLLWSTNSLGGGHSESNLAFMDGHVYWAHGSGLHVFKGDTGELVHVEPAPDKSSFWLVTADKGRVFAQTNRHLYAFAPWGHEEALE